MAEAGAPSRTTPFPFVTARPFPFAEPGSIDELRTPAIAEFNGPSWTEALESYDTESADALSSAVSGILIVRDVEDLGDRARVSQLSSCRDCRENVDGPGVVLEMVED